MNNTHRYGSTKRFDNFSVAIRQHKAQHSHCKLLHGYAFEIVAYFVSNEPDVDKQLDDMNWIVDYGGFKDKPKGNGLKTWLNDLLDHTLLIEKDDPYIDLFTDMEMEGLCKLHALDKIGAESLARMIFEKFNEVLSKTDAGRCRCSRIEVFENHKNMSFYEEI